MAPSIDEDLAAVEAALANGNALGALDRIKRALLGALEATRRAELDQDVLRAERDMIRDLLDRRHRDLDAATLRADAVTALYKQTALALDAAKAEAARLREELDDLHLRYEELESQR